MQPLFPDLGEVIPVLLNAEEVRALSGRFAWSGSAFPAGDYSLRNMDKTRFKLLLCEEGSGTMREITEMDESQAYHELHPGAVYMHDGELYEVLKLDLVSRTAEAVPFEGNYYTVPGGTQETRILQVFQQEDFERSHICFGDINVNEVVSMYKKASVSQPPEPGLYFSDSPPAERLRHRKYLDHDPGECGVDLPQPFSACKGTES